MEQLKRHLEKAYKHLGRLQVSGDAVDVVALVRLELRAAWQEASKPPETGETGGEKADGQAD